MRRRYSRPPRLQSLFPVIVSLQTCVPSENASWETRRSERNVPNLRYKAETNGIMWTVDLYVGHFYRAHVGTNIGEVFRSVPSLIGYLRRSLGVAE